MQQGEYLARSIKARVDQKPVANFEYKDKEIDDQCHIVAEIKTKLSSAEEKLGVLHEMAEKGTLQLKCEILSLEKQFQKDKEDFQVYVSTISAKLISTICRFVQLRSSKIISC